MSVSSLIPFSKLLKPNHWREIGRIGLVAIVTISYHHGLLPVQVLWCAIILGLYPLIKTGIKDFIHERKVGTEIFVTMATTIAMIGHEYVAAAVMMTIILIAEFIAEVNTDRARASIKALIGSIPQVALIRTEGKELLVPISSLKMGDIVLVREGEKIPIDGTVVGGGGAVNEASITGESLPEEKDLNSSVLAGTILESGALDIRTEKFGADTMFARIITLVENAEAHQAPVQKLADQVSAWLIPLVIIFLIGVFFYTHDVRKIVTLLIFTSPAELGLATPLVMIAAIARAAQNGVLIKGGVYLEELAKADVIVFDKTGTLTLGQPVVVGVYPVGSLDENTLLTLAAAADRRSSHPLAKAIVAHASNLNLVIPEPETFEMIRGRGVKATVNSKEILIGNEALLKEHGIEMPSSFQSEQGTVIYIALAGKFAGYFDLADKIRPGSKEVIADLKASGVKRIVILTGDNIVTAQRVGNELGVDEVQADLLPEDKVNAIVALQKKWARVVMVGDGVNDAPALARAQVGIAMGARGTQAALEAADVALMADDLSKIVFVRTLARKAYRTIKENLIFGVGVVHVLGIMAALLGWIGPIQAALLHLGPDVLVFLNSIKLLRVRV